MEEDKIRRLLNLYFEGGTSIEEEQELRAYFMSSDVSEEFTSFTPLFSFFNAEKQIQMKGKVNMHQITSTKERTIGIGWYLKVAASVAIFISVFYLNTSLPTADSAQSIYLDTYDNPEEAYVEVKRALLYVSVKMNKGMDAASSSLEKMEPLDDILN